MSDKLTVLLVENDPSDARRVEALLRETRRHRERALVDRVGGEPAQFELRHETRLADGLAHLDDDTVGVDIVLVDVEQDLPDSDRRETLARIRSISDRVPVVVLTGVPDERFGTSAIEHGAQDYVLKEELTPDGLARTIQYAMERTENERQLRTRSDQLAMLNRLTQHDVRNDMSLVVGRAEELTDYIDPRGEEMLTDIITAGNHVVQLTRSVDDAVETITADEPVTDAVALRPLLEDEIETIRRLYGPARVVTTGEIADVRVRGNRLLSSVFGNLLSNAMLYSDADRVEVTVAVSADDEVVRVRIADNGPGIPASIRRTVFEDGVTGSETGSGAGLYIVDRLVDRFGGDVAVESDGSGTVFEVTLERVDGRRPGQWAASTSS